MIIVGCDFHPSWQQVAIFDSSTGEIVERKLVNGNGEAAMGRWVAVMVQKLCGVYWPPSRHHPPQGRIHEKATATVQPTKISFLMANTTVAWPGRAGGVFKWRSPWPCLDAVLPLPLRP